MTRGLVLLVNRPRADDREDVLVGAPVASVLFAYLVLHGPHVRPDFERIQRALHTGKGSVLCGLCCCCLLAVISQWHAGTPSVAVGQSTAPEIHCVTFLEPTRRKKRRYRFLCSRESPRPTGFSVVGQFASLVKREPSLTPIGPAGPCLPPPP